jgi:hypothetical protein
MLAPLLFAFGLASTGEAQVMPDWVARLPVGSSLAAGLQGMTVDATGTTFVTGTAGDSNNNDAITAAFASDGTLLWQSTYDGPEQWHDQARGIAIGPGDVIWVAGNTPDSEFFANVLLLAYDAFTGDLLHETIYSSGQYTFEYGDSIAIDAAGNVYVGGGTTGDGGDGLLLAFDSNGDFLWKRVWDGPALAPYSQDQFLEVALDPDGHLDALVYGVMGSNQPDYVVIEYALDGSVLWEETWGTNANDAPRDMELDAAGDVYVTGTSVGAYATIKLSGDDGGFVWQGFDRVGSRVGATALALDGVGGVYVTGLSDPDGDVSNNNDNSYTVKRSAVDGAPRWSHLFGANCVGCYDGPGDVIADPAGFVFVPVYSSSPPYTGDLLTFALDLASGAELRRNVLAGSTPPEVFYPGPLAFDAAHDLYDGARAYDANTGANEIALVKYPSLRETQFELDVTQLAAGAPATFSVSNATPFANEFVVYGLSGPSPAPIPVLGTTLGIVGPQLLFWNKADANGSLSRTLTVPSGAAGVTIWFQALERGASTPASSHRVR